MYLSIYTNIIYLEDSQISGTTRPSLKNARIEEVREIVPTGRGRDHWQNLSR